MSLANNPKLLTQLLDSNRLADALLGEVKYLKSQETLGGYIAAFTICSQWLETCLKTIVFILMSSVTSGSIGGMVVKERKTIKQEMTLGQTVGVLEKYSMLRNEVNELEKIQILLKEFVPIRNKLTHRVYQTDYREGISSTQSLNKRLTAAIKKSEAIIDEIYRINELFFAESRNRVK